MSSQITDESGLSQEGKIRVLDKKNFSESDNLGFRIIGGILCLMIMIIGGLMVVMLKNGETDSFNFAVVGVGLLGALFSLLYLLNSRK